MHARSNKSMTVGWLECLSTTLLSSASSPLRSPWSSLINRTQPLLSWLWPMCSVAISPWPSSLCRRSKYFLQKLIVKIFFSGSFYHSTPRTWSSRTWRWRWKEEARTRSETEETAEGEWGASERYCWGRIMLSCKTWLTWQSNIFYRKTEELTCWGNTLLWRKKRRPELLVRRRKRTRDRRVWRPMEHAGDTTQSDIIRNNNNTGDYNLDKLNMNHETNIHLDQFPSCDIVVVTSETHNL